VESRFLFWHWQSSDIMFTCLGLWNSVQRLNWRIPHGNGIVCFFNSLTSYIFNERILQTVMDVRITMNLCPATWTIARLQGERKLLRNYLGLPSYLMKHSRLRGVSPQIKLVDVNKVTYRALNPDNSEVNGTRLKCEWSNSDDCDRTVTMCTAFLICCRL
jgi:hypothetical protein